MKLRQIILNTLGIALAQQPDPNGWHRARTMVVAPDSSRLADQCVSVARQMGYGAVDLSNTQGDVGITDHRRRVVMDIRFTGSVSYARGMELSAAFVDEALHLTPVELGGIQTRVGRYPRQFTPPIAGAPTFVETHFA